MLFLLDRNRLERIDSTSAAASASTIIGRASRRPLTGDAGLQARDAEGAFVAAYDAYQMAAEALLLRQGQRATGGDGSHMTIEDAIALNSVALFLGLRNQPLNDCAALVMPLSISIQTAPRLARTIQFGHWQLHGLLSTPWSNSWNRILLRFFHRSQRHRNQ
jgi:hypothetical protein